MNASETAPESVDGNDGLLLSTFGVRRWDRWYGYDRGKRTDLIFDAANSINPQFHMVASGAKTMPVRNVHVVSVDVPARRAGLDDVLRALRDTRHNVTVTLAPLGDRGKFENINLALKDVDLGGIDWLIVVDDDIAFPANFLDRFLYVCERAAFKIAQPAHRFRSHTTWQITQRLWNSLAHATHFVECGPLTAFHRDVFADVLPFPETRWAWGLDVLWGELARRRNFRIGVVDATPIEHLRPVAQSYDFEAARQEARQLLDRFDVRRTHEQIFVTTDVLKRL